MEELATAHEEERGFGARSAKQRRKVLKRARRLKLKSDMAYLIILVAGALYGLLCWAGAAAGFHVLYTAARSADAVSNLGNCTINATVPSGMRLANDTLCCYPGDASALRETSFAMSFMWMCYGLGIFVGSMFGLWVELSSHRVEMRFWSGLTLSLAFIVFVIGFFGLIVVIPGWYFVLGGVERTCVDPTYYSRFRSYLSGVTACFAINIVACCFMTLASML